MSSIFSCWQFIAITTAVVVVTIGSLLDKRKEARENEEKRRCTEANWLRALRDLDTWLSDDPTRSLESPEGQCLLSVEIGAYMYHLEHKENVSASDEEYLRKRIALLLAEKVIYRNPFFHSGDT